MIDEADHILLSPDSLKRKIRENQRFRKHERLLRRIRLRIFDYEDAGKLDKAHRVIARIKVICGPWWEKRAKRIEEQQLSRLRWPYPRTRTMPVFQIEQFELHSMKYQVEASSEAEAITKLLDGEADPVDNSLEFIEVADDFGMPVDENRDLAEELTKLGVPVGEHVIPSIRSIEEVE